MPEVTPNEPGPEALVAPFEGTDAEWDACVASLPGSTFCHLAGWRHAIGDALGHECFRWVARDVDGALSGVLPLVRVKSRLFGDYLLSMPFLSYGGPIGTPDARRALAQEAASEAERLGVDLMELRVREAIPCDLTVSDRKLTVVKELPDSSEALWENGLKAKVRSQVRRPMKEGMTTRFGLDGLADFYHVFARTMRDLGTPVLPRRFFEAVARSFPERAVLGVVDLEGEPVAAGLGFEWGGEVEITWAGALREHSRRAPNMLLYWGFMEESIRRGATRFNFGRCSPGSGTHRFKLQWGSEEQPLPWTQWAPGGVAATPNPDSPKFRLATATWSRLPVAVTNLIGPPISRLLP